MATPPRPEIKKPANYGELYPTKKEPSKQEVRDRLVAAFADEGLPNYALKAPLPPAPKSEAVSREGLPSYTAPTKTAWGAIQEKKAEQDTLTKRLSDGASSISRAVGNKADELRKSNPVKDSKVVDAISQGLVDFGKHADRMVNNAKTLYAVLAPDKKAPTNGTASKDIRSTGNHIRDKRSVYEDFQKGASFSRER
jgi:hypothetical protein